MENRFKNLIFTNHALKRLYDRKITQSDAWYTFKHADGQQPGKTAGTKKFFKNYGQQRIELIAKQNEKNKWVVLSCWSKLKGNNQPIFKKKFFLETLVEKIVKKVFKS